jgi:hypothetical protein
LKCCITLTKAFIFAGKIADSGNRAVKVVSDSQAQDAKQAFSEILSEQIYSLTPSVAAPDALSLIAGDVEQARQMMSAMLKNDKPDSDGRVRYTRLRVPPDMPESPSVSSYVSCPTATTAFESFLRGAGRSIH